MKASPYLELANELEITKAVTYLKMKEFSKVCNICLTKHSVTNFKMKANTMSSNMRRRTCFDFLIF